MFSSNRFPVLRCPTAARCMQTCWRWRRRLRRLGAELLVSLKMKPRWRRPALGLPVAAGVPEWLTPLVNVLPGQVLAGRLAVEKGFDPTAARAFQGDRNGVSDYGSVPGRDLTPGFLFMWFSPASLMQNDAPIQGKRALASGITSSGFTPLPAPRGNPAQTG